MCETRRRCRYRDASLPRQPQLPQRKSADCLHYFVGRAGSIYAGVADRSHMLALKMLKGLVAVLDADCIWHWMHSGEIIAHTLTDQDSGDAFQVDHCSARSAVRADSSLPTTPIAESQPTMPSSTTALLPIRRGPPACGTRTAANVVGLEMKKVLQKLNRTPTTFALEPPCMSPSVPQAPDRWCIRQKKSTSGMALKERFNSGPR